jgi:sugar phosphate isomerase/epimerase
MPATNPAQIVAQMYTVCQHTQSAADAAQALRKVKSIGFDVVQMSGHNVPAQELAKILKSEGITCCATHAKLERLRLEPQKVIEEQHILGCKHVAVGGYFPQNPTESDWRAFAHSYNEIAAKFADAGLHLGYHNHSHELVRHGPQTALDILLKEFSQNVWIELDTYWIQHGGGDPAQWIAKVANRIPMLHLKDMAITPDRQPLFAEIGEGNLNWPAILTAARRANVRWYCIEQDTCQRDPFESLALSLKNLRTMGIK